MTRKYESGQGLAEYGLFFLMLLMIITVIVAIFSPKAPPPHSDAFPYSSITAVHDCADMNLTVRDGRDEVDAEGTLHCLYNAGFALTLHGDPIIRPTLSGDR